MIGKFSVFAVLPVAGFFFWLILGQKNESGLDHERFSESVNLALRRTAHYLLAESGDSTARIPAVEHLNGNSWRIRLESAFNYDRIPELLQSSFKVHQITQNYDVSVMDCDTGALLLGYNFFDFVQQNEAPCRGRELANGCYTLQVTFLNAPPTENRGWPVYGAWILGLLSAAGIYYRFRPKAPKSLSNSPSENSPEQGLAFGNSMLDIANQTLMSNGKRHELTYREAKLLQLFASHPNQLLERDFILKSVWEDEGIMVGRSVDVFVSRLRKMLKSDSAVQISAVHGVGYRLSC